MANVVVPAGVTKLHVVHRRLVPLTAPQFTKALIGTLAHRTVKGVLQVAPVNPTTGQLQPRR